MIGLICFFQLLPKYHYSVIFIKILYGGVSEGFTPLSTIFKVMFDSIFSFIKVDRSSTNSLRSSLTSLFILAIKCTLRSALCEQAIIKIAKRVQKTIKRQFLNAS